MLRPILLTIAAITLLGADPTPSPTIKAILALHWSQAPQHLNASNSTITPPSHVAVVRDSEARQYEKLTNGDSESSVEAVAMDFQTAQPVYMEYNDSGYVTVDDWKNIDTDQMLQDIKQNTEDANEQKKTQGIAALHVLDWVQKPTYDSSTKTVRWAISAKEEDESQPIINSVALVLGRHGYEKLTWVVNQPDYVGHGGLLDRVLSAQRFNAGARYQDYVSGDKLAGFGVAALVGTVAGATLYKVGAFAALLLLLKKVWFLIAAAVIGAYKTIQKRLKGPQFGPSTPDQ